MSTLAGHFVDVVQGLPTLVAFRRADAQTRRIREVSDRHRRATLDTLRLAFASSAVLELLATISVALVAVAVGLRLRAGDLDLETALVVLLLAPEAYWPLRRMGAEFHAAAEGGAALRQVAAVLDAPQTERGEAVGDLRERTIVLNAVSTTFPGREQAAVDQVSATIRPRSVVAVAGPSGAGKSTLLGILRGELDYDGSVRIGDRPLSRIDRDEWARSVAWIPQRPWLVAGTLAANVRIAEPEASDEQVRAALEQVGLGKVVAASAAGLDQEVDEDGRGLSAGVRARLALARAVVAHRSLVLLDEPTAHLDEATEQIVLATIEWLSRRSTVVVVAHRAAVLDIADTVITLAGRDDERPAADRSEVIAPPLPATEPEPHLSDDDPGSDRAIRRLVGGIALGCLATAAGVALTATAGWLIVRASEHPPVLTLLVAIVAVRTFGIARPVLRYAERLVSHDAALRDLGRIRADVFARLIPITPGALGPRRGDVLASVVDDVDAFVDERLRVWTPVATALSVGLASAALVWFWSSGAGLILAALTLTAALAFVVTCRAGRAAEASFVDERSLLSDEIAGFVDGRDSLTAWQATGPVLDRVREHSDSVGRTLTRSAVVAGSMRALILVRVGAAVVGCGSVLTDAVAGGSVSPSAATLIVLVPLGLAEALGALPEAGAVAVRVRAAMRRLGGLARLRPAVTDPEPPTALLARTPALAVDSVTAGWTERDVLVDVDLELPAGARLGIVGPSGAGKSTLAALLIRFIDPRRGRITFDAVDARATSLDEVRRVVGLVDDAPHVFASSVVENVRLARPAATDHEVAVALRRASLGRWLDQLPEGLHTRIGDGGSDVSGGERARLGVARSLLADQPVLVLDEPTAHLDTSTAYDVLADALAAGHGRSVVLITHRADALDHVDTVLTLGADGRLVSLESSHGVRDQ
jgi:ATP-binding cassette subfamily C protein CydCD